MDKDQYQDLSSSFRHVTDDYLVFLSEEARNNVLHYLDVAELEMAYESFVLSVIEEGIALADSAKGLLWVIGLALGLDKESVFRADFWQFARPYIKPV